MRPALRLADAAVVLLDDPAMAGEPGTLGARALRPAIGDEPRLLADRRPAARTPWAAGGHDDAARVRDAGVEQLDLEPQDRVQPGGLGRGREPDRAVQALVVGDRERRHPELDRPRDEVVGRRGAVEEREVAVTVELGVSGHETVSGGRAQIVEQMFGSCQREIGARRRNRSRPSRV